MEIPAIVGGGLVVIGAGIGIGRIGGSALEAMARQPELTGKIQTVMLIAAALIEGIGFGVKEPSVGEIVFNTSMSGYQEIITDPSYKKQIITFTCMTDTPDLY